MDPAGIAALIDAIRHAHGCEARWIQSVPVHEKLSDGRTAFEGDVEVFELVGHPKAGLAYGWAHASHGTERRFHTVLGVYPVDSPVMAIRTAILAALEARRKKD